MGTIDPSILLLNIKSKENHLLTEKEHVIGRGWLNVSKLQIICYT